MSCRAWSIGFAGLCRARSLNSGGAGCPPCLAEQRSLPSGNSESSRAQPAEAAGCARGSRGSTPPALQIWGCPFAPAAHRSRLLIFSNVTSSLKTKTFVSSKLWDFLSFCMLIIASTALYRMGGFPVLFKQSQHYGWCDHRLFLCWVEGEEEKKFSDSKHNGQSCAASSQLFILDQPSQTS